MRLVSLLVVASSLGACAGGDDEGPFRPGGGGGSGSSQGGDARQPDANGDGGGDLNGLICIVSDLRVPEACPTVAAQSGVPVGVVGAPATAMSGSDGRFTLAVTASVVTLDVATGSTTLVRALVPVAVVVVGGSLVQTPVATQVAFDAAIASLGTVVPDGGGTIVAYVADGTSPAVSVTFDTVAGSSLAPFYDNGGATSWVQGGGTGVAGVALFVDVPAGSVTIEGVAPDTRVARATVPVQADAVTFVQLGLVAGP